MLDNSILTTEHLKYCIDKLLFNKIKLSEKSAGKINNSCMRKYKYSLPAGFCYDYPVSVMLRVTSQCNLRCRHCFFSGSPDIYTKNNEFSKDELFHLIDFLADDVHILSLLLTGGEPFIRKDFTDIVKHAKEKFLPLIIQTNGTLLNENIINNMSSILFPKTDLIHISLDGANADSNDKIRGLGTFDKAVNAIKLFRKCGIQVQVNITLTTISAPKIAEIFSLCRTLNVNKLSINSFQVCNESHNYLKLTPEENIFYNYLIYKKQEEFPDINVKIKTLDIYDFLSIPEAKEILDSKIKDIKKNANPCLSCHNHDRFCISANGDVFFCSMDESDDAIIGNIRQNNFYDIWDNRFSTPYFQKRDISTTKCKECEYISVCHTGCMASAYKKYKDINMAPAECTYFQKYIKDLNL